MGAQFPEPNWTERRKFRPTREQSMVMRRADYWLYWLTYHEQKGTLKRKHPKVEVNDAAV